MPAIPTTAGTNFVRAAIIHEATGLFRNTSDPDLFLDEEIPVYAAVAAHLASYGKLPSLPALAAQGLTFVGPEPPEPPAFYADRIRSRAAYNAIAAKYPSFSASLKDRNLANTITLLRDMLAAAAGKIEASNYSSLGFEAQRVLADFQFAKQHPGLRGASLRWDSLNHATNGAMGGDLCIFAGRPGTGKSWLLLELALRMHAEGKTVAFASMEMSLLQIARRWLGGKTGINPNDMRAGTLAHWSEAKLLAAVEALANESPVHLFRGDMKKNVDGIAQMMDEFNPDVLFVDALYLLSPTARKAGSISRWEAVSEVVRDLKQLALHKDRPVIGSVQFNRNQRNKPKKKGAETPDLSDVAGSDSIPQDASILVGTSYWPAPFTKSRRILHLMKNREGETVDFGINFSFAPVNFDEIPLPAEHDGDGGSPPQPVADTSWMF